MRLFLIGIASILLISCGFHLRGQVNLPAPLKVLYIKTSDPYSQLIRYLKTSLQLAGARLTDTPTEAKFILEITRESYSQQLLSVGGTQETRQYNLSLSISFQVTDNDNHVFLKPQILTETRSFTLQANKMLGGSNEQQLLYEQMRDAIVFNILTRLSSPQTFATLTSASAELPHEN